MSPDFKAPANNAEFERRAADITIDGAKGVIKTLERRKAAAIKPLDDEIEFYKKVLEHKGESI